MSDALSDSGDDVRAALQAIARIHATDGREVFRFSLYSAPECHTRTVVRAVHALMWSSGQALEGSQDRVWRGPISEVLRRLGVDAMADPRQLNKIAGDVSRILRLNGLAIQVRHREWRLAPWRPGPIRTRGIVSLEEAQLWSAEPQVVGQPDPTVRESLASPSRETTGDDRRISFTERWLRRIWILVTGRGQRGRHLRSGGSGHGGDGASR